MNKNRITTRGLKGLELAVARICNAQAEGYDNGTPGFLRDLFYGGCASGIVGALVYYRDTTRFYRKHQDEIRAMVRDALSDFGFRSLSELFPASRSCVGWDGDDPFADEETNQNLLAWYAFEETARRLSDRMGWED